MCPSSDERWYRRLWSNKWTGSRLPVSVPTQEGRAMLYTPVALWLFPFVLCVGLKPAFHREVTASP